MSLDSRLRQFRSKEDGLDLAASLSLVKAKAKRKVIVRRVGMAMIAVAVVAAAVSIPTVLSGQRPMPIGPAPHPSPSVSFHAATPTDRARLIAFIAQNDLWVYDVAADRSTRLTANGDQRSEDNLTFYGDRYVLYSSSNPATIEAMPIGGGPPITIVDEGGTILALDVSVDGASIVYIHTDFERDNTHRLKRVAVSGGESEVLRELGTVPGRGAGSEDEVSVAYSPDGRSILVTDTHTGQEPTGSIQWLDAAGKNIVRPWSGTHARWTSDGRTILYRGYGGLGDSRWRAFDVASHEARSVALRQGANNLVVSPDGRYVAYDTSSFGDTPLGTVTSKDAPRAYIYDLERGRETLLRSGSVFPTWISPNELIVTNARKPTRPSLNSWEATGKATKVRVDGTDQSVSITTTAWTSATLFDD